MVQACDNNPPAMEETWKFRSGQPWGCQKTVFFSDSSKVGEMVKTALHCSKLQQTNQWKYGVMWKDPEGPGNVVRVVSMERIWRLET